MKTAMEIIAAVALGHHTTPDVLRSKRYPVKLFQARRFVYELLRQERGLSLNQIGSLMGGRGHTTIYHALSETRRQRAIAKVQKYRRSPRAGTLPLRAAGHCQPTPSVPALGIGEVGKALLGVNGKWQSA